MHSPEVIKNEGVARERRGASVKHREVFGDGRGDHD